MLIRYKPNVEHVKCIPLIPDPKDPKSYSRNQILLLPGTNEISDDEWEAIKPHIAAEIKSGEVVQMDVKSKKKDGKARRLKDVPVSIAMDIISKCHNPDTLKKWFKEEGRDEVLLAVTKRMRRLKLDPEEIEKELEKENDKPDETETETEGDDTDQESGDKGEGDEDDLSDEDETETEGDDIPDFDEKE